VEDVAVDTKDEVQEIILRLNTENINMAQFERTFNLPKRTLARWKKGNCSAAGLSLLRIVNTYPWVMQLASSGYTPEAAQYLLVKNASSTITNALDRFNEVASDG
jgi:hypothetical protein